MFKDTELPPQRAEAALPVGQREGTASGRGGEVARHADVPPGHAGPGEIEGFPLWKAHQGGDRKGYWSLHVTRNWRLTFGIRDGEIVDVSYEDYH